MTEWVTKSKREKLAIRDELLARIAERTRHARDPYPWQRPHTHPEGWAGLCGPQCADLPDLVLGAHDMWLLMGGRGTGKTDATSIYLLDHVAAGPCDPSIPGGHRIAIVAPTIGDAMESSVTGPSGLLHYDRRLRVHGGTGGAVVRWPNGARAKLFGAHSPDDVNRLRSGGNTCLVVLEEAAAQRRLADVLEQSAFGLRIGPHPHYIAATTPKVRPEIRALASDRTVHMTRGRTQDATALDAAVRAKLDAKYAGTTVGRQEMDGELLSDVEGAPWTRALIDTWRVKEPPPLGKVIVAVDPNAGGPDECGIIVAGLALEPALDEQGILAKHLYVLDDLSGHFRHPGQWAQTALFAVERWHADGIVAEVNQGGNMVTDVIRQRDPSVSVRTVHAAEGKYARTGPIVGLSEQGRVHMVGSHPKLEDQMTTWLPSESWSPDRMDAFVWAASDLAVPRTRRRGHSAAA